MTLATRSKIGVSFAFDVGGEGEIGECHEVLVAMRSLRYLLIPVIAPIVCAAVVRGRASASATRAWPYGEPSADTRFRPRRSSSTVRRCCGLPRRQARLPDAMPIETRSFLITGAIAQLLAIDPDSDNTAYDPATFKVSVQKQGSEVSAGRDG